MVWRLHNFGSALRFFLLILHNKRDQEVHENFINCFLRKSQFDQFDLFRLFFNVSLDVVKIELGRCYYWILK